MRIAQITDLHLSPENVNPRNLDLEEHLNIVCEAVKTSEVDYVVVTGDLCWQIGEPEIYKRVKKILDSMGLPYYCLSGNHDDPSMLAAEFGMTNLLGKDGSLYYQSKLGEWPALFLDTTPGSVSAEQLVWLDERLAEINRPLLLFIHHPPVEVPVWFMERKYPLTNRSEITSRIHRFPHQVYSFSGHYHSEFSATFRNLQAYVTPSCFFQIRPFELDFCEDHSVPAFRIIDIHEKQLRTTVRYLF